MANSSVWPGVTVGGIYQTPGGCVLTCIEIDEDTIWFQVGNSAVQIDLTLWVATQFLTPLSEPNYEGAAA